MPRIEPPEYVNGNAGNPDRIRIRQQLRIIIADVLFEIGMKITRLSRRIKPPEKYEGLDGWITHGEINLEPRWENDDSSERPPMPTDGRMYLPVGNHWIPLVFGDTNVMKIDESDE